MIKKFIKYFIVVHILAVGFFYFGVQIVSTQKVKPIPSPIDPNHSYLYFAYGSNMSSKYLINVRGVVPEKKDTGMLRNYQFTFGLKGVNSIEPGFASITPSKGETLYGVVYMLSGEDFENIILSESSRYNMRKVLVDTSVGEVTASTLVLNGPTEKAYLPSKRYLSLVLEGAEENELPPTYIAEIEGTPTADYYPVASEIMGAVIQAWVLMKAW